jgi:hypothetical protein
VLATDDFAWATEQAGRIHARAPRAQLEVEDMHIDVWI